MSIIIRIGAASIPRIPALDPDASWFYTDAWPTRPQ
jgi:hypothetical protein